MFKNIISVEDLEGRLGEKDWLVIDARFDLSNPSAGHEAYLQAHIPGAIYAHLDDDLSGPKSAMTGRHPLPSASAFRDTLTRWGVNPRKQIVVYDAVGGAFAARLWWMLRAIGHERAAVLEGGFPAWQAADLPTVTGDEEPPRTRKPYPEFEFNRDMFVSTSDVGDIRNDPAWRLLDARSPERFRGEVEPIDPVAGHIPGAVNRFHGLNLDPEGRLQPKGKLQADFAKLLEGVQPDHVVVYCGSGVTSAHHILVMDAAGLPMPKLYIGSWSEWIRDPQRPVAKDT